MMTLPGCWKALPADVDSESSFQTMEPPDDEPFHSDSNGGPDVDEGTEMTLHPGSDAGTDVGSDSGTESDGVSPTDTTTDTGLPLWCIGEDVWYDPVSNLCWDNRMNDETVCQDQAVDRCTSLVLAGSANWDLPNAMELISLLRGCAGGSTDDSSALSYCRLAGQPCPFEQPCETAPHCQWCIEGNGPGQSGLYMDPFLQSAGDWFLSATDASANSLLCWVVNFATGAVMTGTCYGYTEHHYRCVRRPPS